MKLENILSSETIEPILAKFGWNGPWVVLTKIVSNGFDLQTKLIEKGGWIFKIFSETVVLIFTKLLKWSSGGPLSELCPMTWSIIQDGRQAKNRKRWMTFEKSSPLKILSQS